MWNKPQLMTAVADLLFAAATAALLVAAAVWFTRLPHFRLSQVVVAHELTEVKRADVERAMSGLLRGNFFSANVEALRLSLEKLSWVRHAEVRRRWPSGLEVRIEEHRPVAQWGEAGGQLVNTYGEVFAAVMTVPQPLPVLHGPLAVAPEMLGYYREAVDLLKPLGRAPRVLTMSPRLAVQLKLDDGMVIELGRQQAKVPIRTRLQRFVNHYPSVLTVAKARPSVVDMRYPNGFALRLAAAQVTESKGKQ
ncbi:MAG: FtsQ-type POTRA domain-containing protein [Rhodocyclales bacterium]|nr:FtsQ-type POTRA domain-containing protein [Rhodocyclales bacterium]